MSAFSRTKLSAPDLSALVTDPELLAATGTIREDIANIGSTLGPAITAGTQDKATSSELDAVKTHLDTSIKDAADAVLYLTVPGINELRSNSDILTVKADNTADQIVELQSNLTTAKTDILNDASTNRGALAEAIVNARNVVTTAISASTSAISGIVTTIGSNTVNGLAAALNALGLHITASVNAARDAVLAGVTAMAQPGDLKLKINANGVADTGWTRASGNLSAIGLYEQTRLAVANISQSVNANNTTTIFQVTPGTVGTAYVPSTGATRTIAAHPNQAGGNVGQRVADDEYVYTAGGATSGLSSLYSEVRRMNIVGNFWTTVATLPTPRLYPAIADLGARKILVAGGQVAAAATIANLTDAFHIVNTDTGAVTSYSLGFRAYNGMTLTLKNGPFAGYVLIYWPANNTTNGPSSSSTWVATPRAVLISPAGAVTEIDGFTGVAVYERNDGKVVEVSSNMTGSTIRDLTKALGAQTSGYALPGATGIALSANSAITAPKILAGNQLPVLDGTRAYYLTVDGVPEPASQAFYQVKN